MRTRHRITRAVCQHENKRFTITFQPDGVHIRQHCARQERIIPILDLLSSVPHHHSTAPNGHLQSVPAQLLDVAACDLAVLADQLQNKVALDQMAIAEVKLSVTSALKLVKAMEILR